MFWSKFTHYIGKLDHFRVIEASCSKNKTLQLTKMSESIYTTIKLYKIGFRTLPNKMFWSKFTDSIGKLDCLGQYNHIASIVKTLQLTKMIESKEDSIKL